MRRASKIDVRTLNFELSLGGSILNRLCYSIYSQQPFCSRGQEFHFEGQGLIDESSLSNRRR